MKDTFVYLFVYLIIVFFGLQAINFELINTICIHGNRLIHTHTPKENLTKDLYIYGTLFLSIYWFHEFYNPLGSWITVNSNSCCIFFCVETEMKSEKSFVHPKVSLLSSDKWVSIWLVQNREHMDYLNCNQERHILVIYIYMLFQLGFFIAHYFLFRVYTKACSFPVQLLSGTNQMEEVHW